MFEVNNGVAKIDGSRGKYDGGKYESKVSDPSVRYGRNAVENYYTYLLHSWNWDKFSEARSEISQNELLYPFYYSNILLQVGRVLFNFMYLLLRKSPDP